MQRAFHNYQLSWRPTSINVFMDRKGLRTMWDINGRYSVQKARPDDFSLSQRDSIQKAYSSVSWWLNTPVTRITILQMKRFRKFIYARRIKQVVSITNRINTTLTLCFQIITISTHFHDKKKYQNVMTYLLHKMSSSSINDPLWLDDTHLLEVIKSESTASTVSSTQLSKKIEFEIFLSCQL